MPYIKPSAAEFKAYFARDFPYGTTVETVMDADIEKAQGQASFNFNEAIISDQARFTILFNYLTAHFLCLDLRMAAQGVSSQYNWVRTSKAVGSVSEGYQVPDRIMANPELAMLTQTGYGGKYLQLILPQLLGQIFVVAGKTQA